ncbi:serine/arginine repetitive matrix protein 3-like [Sturnira hondurensis]|uniref:serine/arginine repetitive matrix protein 3-like n=1 Tax=Sturnira hondurensis TaxID=192404 RepID=UPI001879FB32|nr:serine/arginine repetitive matrix protein 3-like [Sturnira hondurensis]
MAFPAPTSPGHQTCSGDGRRGGGGGPGTAEPSPERDANRLSWEKSLRARELSMLPPRAAPACTQPREGATGRRRWPPEGVWDPAGCT